MNGSRDWVQLRRHRRKQGSDLVLQGATRGYVLEARVVTLEGSAAELRANPAVITAYLGL
jgi:ABC-type branched-subunit amino acid transport system ATPase component